jgi:hypothetical protein
MEEGEKLKAKEINEFGARLTIFENGDVYVSTPGDIHVLFARCIFDELPKGEI